jgi:hypothetical protein
VLSPAIARSLVKRFVAPAGRHGSRTPAHRPVPAAPRPSVGRPQAPAPQTSIGGIKLDLPDRLPVLPQVQKVVDDSDAAVNDLLDYLLKP